MKITSCFVLFMMIAIVSSVHISEDQYADYTRKINQYGDITYHQEKDDSEEVVLVHSPDPRENPTAFAKALANVLEISKKPEKQKQFLQCAKGKHSQFFKFGAADVGTIGKTSEHEVIILEKRQDDCFDQVLVNFTLIKHNAVNTAIIEIFAGQRKKQFCTETYILATAAKFHIHTFSLRKHHKFVWKNMNDVQYSNVKTWGIHVFRLCDQTKHWVMNVLKTAEVFIGGLGTNPKIPFFGSKPPKYMEKLAIDFIEAGTGFRWKQRKPAFMNLTSDEVHPGDFLAITRFDGIDQIIQYGAGSHSGHSAVVLRVDGVLSVVQSQDGWYWPKHGIQRNDWQTWKKWALNAGFNVAVLPLSKQSRANFDEAKAQKFFKQMEGFPYGYHNFLLGWIDTENGNLPPLLDGNFVLAAFSMLQRIYEYPINRILTQAMNKRLGTQHLKLSQIAVQMSRRNMTFNQLLAIVQKDGWWYNDGPSYVCSSFVAAVYKAGGLLKDIEGVEFTPKDVYTLTIYDKNYVVPKKCLANDPTLPYCQIMGSYLMELPGYATIEQYPHMCERCPTMTPDFFRPDGC